MDENSREALELIEAAGRQQAARDLDNLDRLTDIADRIAAREIAVAAADLERMGAATGELPFPR